MHALLPWAVAGFAGWLCPKLFKLQEDWQSALVAAVGGALVGFLLMH
jgi:hypothetical protein